MSAAVICETVMIFCFGLSWPMNIIKSLKSRTAKGKSILFMCFIEIGYIFGIAGKFITKTYNLALVFYFINFAMVLFDICLYFRNSGLDRERDAQEK